MFGESESAVASSTNFLAESKDGKEQAQMLASPVFEGARMYWRTPGHLVCIGEK